jgi:hypothetical protein
LWEEELSRIRWFPDFFPVNSGWLLRIPPLPTAALRATSESYSEHVFDAREQPTTAVESDEVTAIPKKRILQLTMPKVAQAQRFRIDHVGRAELIANV